MGTQYAPCKVDLVFADKEYEFRLPLKMIAELETVRGAPIGAIYERVIWGHYYAQDLHETVRLGLIGGGLDPLRARQLIDTYCDEWPLEVWLTHAKAILLACIVGYTPPDNERVPSSPGKQTGDSTSQERTETLQ